MCSEMACDVNINALVALTTAAFQRYHSLQSAKDNSFNGTVSYPTDVLDSMAELCVTRPGESIAVGFAVDGPEDCQRSQLFIAANSDEGVFLNTKVIHLREILFILQRIALCATDTKQSKLPANNSVTSYQQLREVLMKEVYSFSYLNFWERMSRSREVLDHFRDAYNKWTRQQPLGYIDETGPMVKAMMEFIYLMSISWESFRRLSAASIYCGKAEWVQFTHTICRASEIAVTIMDDRNICWIWEERTATEGLAQAIVNVTGLQYNIEMLCHYSSDHNLLSSKIPVQIVLAKHTPAAFMQQRPVTSEDWEDLQRAIYEMNSYSPQRLARIEIPPRLAPHAHPHPECRLIQYFGTQSGGTFRPRRYIGLSKPSCQPCILWVDAYNSLNLKHNYTTRHCDSDEWDIDWKMPQLYFGPMYPKMLKSIGRAYCLFQGLLGEATMEEGNSNKHRSSVLRYLHNCI